MYQYNVGIDIGKEEFVVAIHMNKKTSTYPNTPEGFEVFFKEHGALLTQALVVLETTGGYEEGLLIFLYDKKIALHRASGRQIKNFIRSYGQYAKTDKIDALAIARYSLERQSVLSLYQPVPEVYEKLKGYVMRRLDLVQMLVQEKNRIQSPKHISFRKNIKNHIEFLEKELGSLDEEIRALQKKDKVCSLKIATLKTVEGIGEKTASSLLALLPELGHLDRKEIASLAGLAPHAQQSGKSKGYSSTTYGGRRDLRPILFVAAMAAARSKGKLGQWYRKLVEQGKKKMVALVALMRKMVVVANARIKELNLA